MKSYIFITEEGVTYQPNSLLHEPDIENCQVIGFAKGIDENKAFENLIKENGYLLDTNFDEIICIELKFDDYYKKSRTFYLNEYR
ncbi:MAG: hypothetical protein J7J73_03125 [Deltaproteobacteria bacterium]|nr:hypothetical protein [Deltaproteobacteria bacterium]